MEYFKIDKSKQNRNRSIGTKGRSVGELSDKGEGIMPKKTTIS